MDFTPTDEQAAARELAAQIFGDLATHERLTALGSGSDAQVWKALSTAGLIAAVEETGLLGLVLLLEEQGRTTAQTPFAAACVYGLLAVAAHGSDEQRAQLLPGLRDGTMVATGAFPLRGAAVRADGQGRLTGVVPYVPWLRDATHVLVPAAEPERAGTERAGRGPVVPEPSGCRPLIGCFLLETAGLSIEPVELTAPWAAGRLVLDDRPAERIGGPDAYDDILAMSRTAFAGLQAGVCAGSLARAVEHTSAREQFGRPLSTNQGVLLRAADAYMDTEAIRVTAYEAAWRRDARLPYATHALTAAWWASEAGKRVVHVGQHLHGGTGADLGHPVHRHFLWGRQLDAYLGSGSEVLSDLGALLAGQEPV
ncbi:acyl-CoA dehydrogenase family protein [Streptomyces sp. NPDC058572]|uniref:acyl-CoA dehydrogenase family protein n=1 Tax=Streptomyces sp. NPDC058572 TaxID=3346546 RepID=UPI003658F039